MTTILVWIWGLVGTFLLVAIPIGCMMNGEQQPTRLQLILSCLLWPILILSILVGKVLRKS